MGACSLLERVPGGLMRTVKKSCAVMVVLLASPVALADNDREAALVTYTITAKDVSSATRPATRAAKGCSNC